MAPTRHSTASDGLRPFALRLSKPHERIIDFSKLSPQGECEVPIQDDTDVGPRANQALQSV
jgi:hypothetical protein